MEMSELIKGTIQELIETLWNVNSFDTVSATGTTRINRNIVECK